MFSVPLFPITAQKIVALSMQVRHLFLLLIQALLPVLVHAQDTLKGKVYKGVSDTIVAGASVFNTVTRKTAFSAADGSYAISANEGDKVVFNFIETGADTVVVAHHMLRNNYDANLRPFTDMLEGVKVRSGYSADSLARRQYYQDMYKKQPGITGHNRPTDGFGVSVSPLSFFSSSAKQKRKLKKRLLKQEEDAYIDHAFPVAWVSNLTGLKGDSLSLFMYRYRPSYEFCRATDRRGMIVYIGEKLKAFRKPED